VLDTNIPEGSDGKFNTGDVYTVTGRSVLVLAHVDEPAA
jgi:isoamylase